MNIIKEKYQSKKVLVVGLGLQGGGVGVAKFFAELGAKVTVTDKKDRTQLLVSIEVLKDYPIEYHLGGHILSDFEASDVIFKGPSVPWTIPEIVAAEKKGIPVEMELSFFAKHFPGKIIGVTGTRGKSTTTHLIFNLLKLSGYPVYLGGGLPGISTINYLKTLEEKDYLVAELSSFSLSGFHRAKISPHIAVFTNIYPDHLNYYKKMDEYLYDKKAVYFYQKKDDSLIINKSLLKYLENPKSSVLEFNSKDFPGEMVYLKGEHNAENAAAALKAAELLKIDREKAIKIISNFKGLPFRQEIVGEKSSVIFVNDTTSTTPTSTIKAIESFKDKKIVLILGGNSKNLPWEELIAELDKVERIVLLSGSFTNEILDTLQTVLSRKITAKTYDDLSEAVEEAYRLARELHGGYVLFSPAATSFAMFNNEFHRGKEFNRTVEYILNN